MNRPVIIGVIVGIIALAGFIVISPRSTPTIDEVTGDPELSNRAAELAPKHDQLTAATFDGNQALFGGRGADEHTEVEIGSVTKTMTAELARQQVEAGELEWDTPLGDILDLGDSEAATITIEELVNHTSGLKRLATFSPGPTANHLIRNGNPYVDETEEVTLEAARTTSLSNRGEEAYSNFGYGLLGLALAENAGKSQDQLFKEGIFEPAGMTESYLALPGTVSEDAPRGLGPDGRRAAAWEMSGGAAAGAVRSTATDMIRYAEYMMDNANFTRGWPEDEEVGSYWHNGGTGGYRSALFIDPETRTAAWVNTTTNHGTEATAAELLKHVKENR